MLSLRVCRPLSAAFTVLPQAYPSKACKTQGHLAVGIRRLEGHGDVVSRLAMGISRVTIWVIGVLNLLTKPP